MSRSRLLISFSICRSCSFCSILKSSNWKEVKLVRNSIESEIIEYQLSISIYFISLKVCFTCNRVRAEGKFQDIHEHTRSIFRTTEWCRNGNFISISLGSSGAQEWKGNATSVIVTEAIFYILPTRFQNLLGSLLFLGEIFKISFNFSQYFLPNKAITHTAKTIIRRSLKTDEKIYDLILHVREVWSLREFLADS